MADEMTDTTNPTTETPTANDAAAPVVADTPAVEGDAAPSTPAADTEETVLGGKLTEDAPAEPAAPEGPPEAYDLKLEGVDLDTEVVSEAEPILRELKLTNDQAQTLLPVAAKLVERTQERVMGQLTDAFAQQRKDWLDVAQGDQEIGGAKWDETVHLAAKGLDAAGFKEGHPFRQLLTETGFGNNRDMISLCRRLGELVGEDGFVRGGTSEASTAVPLWDRIYSDDK